MSLPRYPEYKPSGVEWLGEVPEHWKKTALKFLAEYQNGFPFKPEDWGMEGLPIIRIAQLTGDGVPNFYSGTLDSRVLVETGDLLFSWSANIDSYIWEKGSAWLNQHIFKVTPSDEADKSFLFYVIKHVAPKLAEFDAHGSTMRHIKKESLGERVFVPPLSEQTQIAAFLDRETAKIDELVAEQRRLMELLKEKRQAVVSHAVTQGLNPDAPMKPSGIEWLGDVPAHWRVGAIKYFVLAKNGSIKTGPFGSHLISSEMQSGTIKVYNQRSVIDGDFDSGDNFISEDKFAELASFETFPGDLLITTRGTIGRAAILPENAERGILHPCLLRLQPDTSLIDTKFLKTLIQDSDLMKTQLSYLSNATTIEVIYSYTIASVIIPVPPILEQAAIMQFLADEIAKFDTLTAEAQSASTCCKNAAPR